MLADTGSAPPLLSRLQVGPDFATIRYIGQLPPANGIWYGVEWDDPARGKHDGVYNGVRYFTCSQPKSGSFIQLGPKVQLGVAFLSALLEKYAGGVEEDAPTNVNEQAEDRVDQREDNTGEKSLSNEHRSRDDKVELLLAGKRGRESKIVVEAVGWEKIRRKQRMTQSLTVVGLADMQIHEAGDRDLRNLVPNITDLDLSRNLFRDWDSVGQITSQLPRLEILRLNSNRLYPLHVAPSPSSVFTSGFPNLRSLSLNSTNTAWSQIELLETCLPNLEEIYLGFNQLKHLNSTAWLGSEDVCKEKVIGFKKLRLVNLESNALARWEDLERFSVLESLEVLLVNNNYLKTINPPSKLDVSAADSINDGNRNQQFVGFQSLRALNVSGNHISEWKSVDNVNAFANLRELRLKNNPVLLGEHAEYSEEIAIGRVKRMSIYNGSRLLAQERANAERYYLTLFAPACKQMSDEEIKSIHPRWFELCDLHGKPEVNEEAAKANSTVLKDRLIEIKITKKETIDGDALKIVRKKILGTMTVRSMKNLIQKLFAVSASKQRLYCVHPRLEGEIPLLTVHVVPLEDDLRELKYYDVTMGDEVVCCTE